MCILAVCEKRPLKIEEFKNCWNKNKDGAGFAWENKFKKGFMKYDDAYDFYRDTVQHILPHVAHFRIGTSGGIVPAMTHPFIIRPDSPLLLEGQDLPLLFHNGVVSDWKVHRFYVEELTEEILEEPCSDTRVVAALVSMYGAKALTSELVNGKFVIFKNGQVLCRTVGFHEKDGVFFSNYDYSYSYSYSGYTAGSSRNTTRGKTTSFYDDDFYDDLFKDAHKKNLLEMEKVKKGSLPLLLSNKGNGYLDKDFDEANKAGIRESTR